MKKTLICAALATAMSPAAWATNGYFSEGYGMKSSGMAGVGYALPQDALAAATNPAGMVLVGNRVDAGLTWFKPNRGAEITAPNPTAGALDGNDKSNFFIPEFGYNHMISPDQSVGVSVYGNGGMNTSYKNGVPLFGQAPGGIDMAQLFIAPTYAFKVNKDHAFGVSLNMAYQRFKAEGLQNFGVANSGYDSSTGWGLHLGYIGKVADNVTIGASWQSKTRMGKFDKYKGLFAEQGGFDIPETYGLGIAVKPTQALTVAFDIQYIKYGSVRSVANTVDCFFVGACALGSDNGPGFGWQNMTVYKLGLSYDVSKDLTLRAGVSTNRQPISNSQTLFNVLAPGVVENHVTLGATWAMSPTSEVTVAYQHAFNKTVNGVGSIGAGFGGGEANLHMKQDSLGIAFGWKL